VVGPNPEIPTFRLRLEGFRQACADAGVEPDESLIALNCAGPVGAAERAAEMLASKRPPTAIFAVNNRMTIGVVRAVLASETRTAVVGFDDFELSDLLPMPVTLVAGEAAELGRRGAELLFERLERGPAEKTRARRIVVPTHLVERGGGFVG
jgi:LacI family transcriptional regulator